MSATIGENRPLRDETNAAYRAFQAALRTYNAFITSYQPITDPAATLAEIQRLYREIGTPAGELSRIKERNNRNPDLFDPAINRRVEEADSEIITYQRGLGQATEAANRALLTQQQEARTPTGPTASSEVTADQTANPTTPPAETVTADGTVTTPRATTTPTTAQVTPTAADGGDSGTNAPTITLEQTQQVNDYSQSDTGAQFAPDQLEQQDPGFNPTLSASTTAGAASKDDNTAANTGTEQAAVNAGQANIVRIEPRGNILDRFHNYTYTASVYVLSPTQFELYQQQPKRTISGYNLLFQSGGAPTGSGQQRGSAAGRADANIQDNRNPFFPFDYYIDTIEIENLIFGKATQAAHGVVSIKFTVVEPNNISLLDNIYQAVQDLDPKAVGQTNYAAAIYLMVIRFYGYDLDGRPVRVGAAADDASQTDPDAVVEKFIPFRIKQINWTVSNQLVNYQFEGVAVGQIIGAATRRGTIPADIQLSGATVQAMLQGDPTYSAKQAPAATPGAATTSGRTEQSEPGAVPGVTVSDRGQSDSGAQAPPKATAAANTSASLISGLMGAMNNQQQQRLGLKEIEIADKYELDFGPGAEKIASATVTKPGKKVAKDRTSGAVPVSKGNTSSASPDKQGMDVTSRNFAIPAGTQVLQAIDQIIRNSNYISDQALVVFDENSNEPRPNRKVSKDSGFQWYNILMQATPLGYDYKRNDYAFQIRYTVVPYTPQEFYSQSFPVPRFQGVHKRYPFWFTGENTQVLDYSASFNRLFTLTIAGPGGESAFQDWKERYSTSANAPFVQVQARSTESDVGADGRANELAANAAEYLYNPSDNAQGKIRILGDPAWIQQGSASGLVNSTNITTDGFNPDGTINFDVRDVLFEIAWQRPEDYSQDTGLADPYARTQASFRDRQPIQSVIYRARKVTSYFNQGRFEQELEGTLYWYPLSDGKNRTPGTQASVRAVDNAIDASRETAPVTTGSDRIATAADSAGSQYELLRDSARDQTGGLGLKLPATIPTGLPALGTGQFTAVDLPIISGAPPATPPTSDGQDISTQDIAEAERINAEASGDQITAQQVASNRRLNEALSAPFARFTNSNQQVSAQAPQDIARET
jgi:hypothetical protein